jgi:hypothetical protein
MLHKLLGSSFRRFLFISAPWLVVATIGIILAVSSAYGAYKTWVYQPLIKIAERELQASQAATSSARQKYHTVEISGASS